jgi:hypothetical protein
MRLLTDHIVDGDSVNHQLDIAVLDEPDHRGACHRYVISHRDMKGDVDGTISIHFQEGPIKEFGVNGITQEALIAICIDRLRSFQAGPFACDDNERALNHLEEALSFLQNRTRARIARGVEGTHEK